MCKHIPCPQHVPFVQEKLLKTKEQIISIECNTRGQSDSNLWFEERRLCLTASNFGLVLKRRESIFPKSILTKQFTSVNSKTKTRKPCLWGQSNEQNAITKYLEKCNHDGQCIKACVQCGLVVNAEAPWLGGSPDCFLHDPSEEKPYGIGEVKCPFSKKDMTIEDACSDSSFLYLHGALDTILSSCVQCDQTFSAVITKRCAEILPNWIFFYQTCANSAF